MLRLSTLEIRPAGRVLLYTSQQVDKLLYDVVDTEIHICIKFFILVGR